MSPAQAEKLQNDVYRRMASAKKLKILGDLILLGRKLDLLKHDYKKSKKIYSRRKKY